MAEQTKHVRIPQVDFDRCVALSDSVISPHAILRAAMKLGLAALEEDRTRLAGAGATPEPEPTPRKRKR